MRIARSILLLASLATLPCLGQELGMGMGMENAHEGHDHGANDPHMHMSAQRQATAGDVARFKALLATVRSGVARYRDVNAARADGFEQFLPDVKQPVYHFTRKLWAFEAVFSFDPLKPTSLLYRQEPNGSFSLVGVMYTAPARFTEDELDARVPVALAPWHQHVNWCVPGALHRDRWRETRDGQPVFGPKSSIATEAPCEAVDGNFLPRVFGWMVHIDLLGKV